MSRDRYGHGRGGGESRGPLFPRVVTRRDGDGYAYEIFYGARVVASGWSRGARRDALADADARIAEWHRTGKWSSAGTPVLESAS